jgi:hypothetical protein
MLSFSMSKKLVLLIKIGVIIGYLLNALEVVLRGINCFTPASLDVVISGFFTC